MKKTKFWHVFSLTAFFLSFFIVTSDQARSASVIADSPCDSLYYESLSARAWLEAQREITQNQNLIVKPDSVFEYTCFDQVVRELSAHATSMLSETSLFGSPLGNTSMDDALQALVGDSLREYINLNFGSTTITSGVGYTMLAGRSTISHQISNVTAGNPASSNYSCDIMEQVWQAAKCSNFISNATSDGFFTFQEYAGSAVDKRRYPSTCGAINTNWAANLGVALSSGPWTNDPVQTYLDQIAAPTSAGSSCSGDPIPTGVRVIRSDYAINDYLEHICIQPGCRYEPTNATSGNCVAQ